MRRGRPAGKWSGLTHSDKEPIGPVVKNPEDATIDVFFPDNGDWRVAASKAHDFVSRLYKRAKIDDTHYVIYVNEEDECQRVRIEVATGAFEAASAAVDGLLKVFF